MKSSEISKILITTSRNPTQMIRTFCNDLSFTIPNSVKINRGKSSLDSIAEKALECEAEKVIISDRWKGDLGKIQLFEVGNNGLFQFYPLIYVTKVKLRKTFENMQTKPVKSLVLQTTTEIPFEAHKLSDALSRFLKIQKFSTDEAIAPNIQMAMQVSLNAKRCIQITFLHILRKIEIGPRITVSHLIWEPRK